MTFFCDPFLLKMARICAKTKPDPWDEPWGTKVEEEDKKYTLRRLEEEVFPKKGLTFDFLMAWGLLASQAFCKVCDSDMRLVTSSRVMDGKVWKCSRTVDGVQHFIQKSLRDNTLFTDMKVTFKVGSFYYDFWTNTSCTPIDIP